MIWVFRLSCGSGGIGLASGAPASQHDTPMRDIELYQKLLGLTAPWRVTAVAVQEASDDTPLGEITVRVGWPTDVPLHCPACEAVVPGYDTRPRR